MSQINVTVVVPTYNRKEMLRETLNSLFDQTYPKDKYEIIVCDGGSKDGTEDFIKEQIKNSPCVLRYLKEENKGVSSARNLGIANALGDIIGFTDDDCVVSNTWIEKAVPYFNNENVGGVIGSTQPQKPPENRKFKIVHFIQINKDIDSYATCNIFYRKNVLLEVGGFDTNLQVGEDTDLGWRVKNNNYIICFDKNILVYHIIIYKDIIQHLKSLRKYESAVLLYKKHPEHRNDLYLGFIYNKKSIYPIFMILFIISYFIGNNISFLFFLLLISSYLWARVFVDSKIKKYPTRFLLFVYHLIPDTIRMYHAIRGSIIHKYLLV